MKKAIPVLLVCSLILTFCKSSKKQQNTDTNKKTENPSTITKATTPEDAVKKPPVSFVETATTNKLMEIANSHWAGTTVEELGEGKNIYTGKCTKCHINYPIEEFSEKKWLHEIDDMSPKAKLTSEEKLKLTKYILSYREMNTITNGN